MPKPRGESGEKNLISERLKRLRAQRNLSQRDLAYALQRRGLDLDKNVTMEICLRKHRGSFAYIM